MLACLKIRRASFVVPCCCMSVPSVLLITWKKLPRECQAWLEMGRIRHLRNFLLAEVRFSISYPSARYPTPQVGDMSAACLGPRPRETFVSFGCHPGRRKSLTCVILL